jgi:hypothetical protein
MLILVDGQLSQQRNIIAKCISMFLTCEPHAMVAGSNREWDKLSILIVAFLAIDTIGHASLL